MFEKLYGYFVTRPDEMIGLGNFIFGIGTADIMAGLLCHIGTTASNSLLTISKVTSTAKTLSDMYPAFPTWWIPESFVGAIPAIMMIFAGIVIAKHGRDIKHFMG